MTTVAQGAFRRFVHQVDVTCVTYANAMGPDLAAPEEGELSAVSRFADGGMAVSQTVDTWGANTTRASKRRIPPSARQNHLTLSPLSPFASRGGEGRKSVLFCRGCFERPR